ncbi:hypothetical protein diail_3606 [Diaporthe ilicicola]|nr:hypothetical protein diail_3606 [Diaporthe ilicicola]
MPWNPSVLSVSDKDLFHYFQCAAYQSLTTFGRKTADLGNVLMRAALANNSNSTTAVLQALLALSSLHRYGVQPQAIELKISSIKALAAASSNSGNSLSATEVIQHVAAGMLLVSFEVHQATCTSSQWACYLAGVEKLLSVSRLTKVGEDGDLAALIDWVHYHDVMTRFTLRHWHRESLEVPSIPSLTDVPILQLPSFPLQRRQSCITYGKPSPSVFLDHRKQSTSALFDLISELCDAVPRRPPDLATSQALKDRKGLLMVLDWRIRTVPIPLEADEALDMTDIIELYRLALLIYAHRVSENLLDQAVKTQQNIDRAFELFSQLTYCERQFPIFILGCEARTDDQRGIIMDLISRTEKQISSRSFNHVTLLLQAVWAQDDLADRELNYWDKMTSIISSCTIVPSLV